ncbi:armadillo-like helical domain-containing protein 3 isoform X1 [Branchiostoma floridae x Branchiostoma japonicum]
MTTTPEKADKKDKESGLLRKGSSSKKPLKEKVVQIYESFFKGEDPSLGNPNFWDEFFLMKANVAYIEKAFSKMTPEQLVALKDNINLLCHRCILTLKEDYQIRVVNALQTMCALIRGVYGKSLGDYGFDIINILVGFDAAEVQMQRLIESVHSILTGDNPAGLKTLSLKLLLILVTATDNVSQNTILEYIMINSVFESVVQILANPMSRQVHGHDALLLLTILVNYRKYESVNPYIVKLSILDDELALNGLGWVISSALTEFNRKYKEKKEEPQSGWLSSITSMVGNIFVGDSDSVSAKVRTNDSILLALYEAVHLNRNFITVLTTSHTETSSGPSSPTTTRAVEGTREDELGPQADQQGGETVQGPLPSTPPPDSSQTTNHMVTFLQYCSIVMQDIKDEQRLCSFKLCLVILTCIAEDQYANSFLHDANMNFVVHLYRMPMRHRKIAVPNTSSRPLACAWLDLTVEFIVTHMMKDFPMELYMRCLGIVHRLLCYQKKCRVRLQYTWKDLWTALINLVKFMIAQEAHLASRHNIFYLAIKVVNLFNLFITYGDTFLPSPTSYDELYYEVIRMHTVFDNLYSMALRHATNHGEHKDSATRLTNALVNIRAIVNHFTPKIDSWSAANHLSSLTEDQVLEVVRSNYDTLTLKLQESLDQYERYAEKPKESAFFTQLVRSIISDFRKSISVATLQQETVLQEFSHIH